MKPAASAYFHLSPNGTATLAPPPTATTSQRVERQISIGMYQPHGGDGIDFEGGPV